MNAELTNTRKRTRLDRKFDRLRDAEEAGKLGKSKTSRAVRKMLENRLAVIGLVVFAIILISCLLAPLISPYDPLTTDLRAMTQPPSLQHLFGTDKLGRDVFSRTLYGGRLSILIGLGPPWAPPSSAYCWAATAAIRAGYLIRSCCACPRFLCPSRN